MAMGKVKAINLTFFIIILVTVVCVTDWDYVRGSYFVYEAFEFIFGPRVMEYDWKTILWDHPGTTCWHFRYRPLEVVTAILLERAFGITASYHLAFQSLLKIFCALSIFFCGRKVFKCTIPPLVAAFFFATNPTLLWPFRGQRYISILLALSIIWTWYFYESYMETKKNRLRLIALLGNLAALMYNELAIMIPPFLLIYGFLRTQEGHPRKSLKKDILLPCYPFFILTGVFVLLGYFAGGFGAKRTPLTLVSLWVNFGYLLLWIPGAFIDLWSRGLFASIPAPYIVCWLGIWVLLLIGSLRSSARAFARMACISLVFYACFMAPVFQLLHFMYTPRFVTGVAGLCLLGGSLFIWAERGGRLTRLIATFIVVLIAGEFSASSISYWKKRHSEETRLIGTFCPAVTNHILSHYPGVPSGSVFVILAPDWKVANNCCDSYIKGLGGRPLSQYLFLAFAPQAGKGWQQMIIPEILWDDIWCEPVEEVGLDWPSIIWQKKDDRSVTLREAIQSPNAEYMRKLILASRDGLRWKEVEACPPDLRTLRQIGWNIYYLKVTADGRITDLGGAEAIDSGGTP